MKKIILVALMLGTLIGYATEDKNTIDVKVEFLNVKKGQTLNIKNNKGAVVYNTDIKNSGDFSKSFDFSTLKDGIYSAELDKDFEIVIKQFYVKNGLVTFLNNQDNIVFKPVVRNEKNILYISKLAFKKEPVKVTIYYKNEAILSEKTEGDQLLKRVYKLSENRIGNYKVIISTDDRTYVNNFTI